MKNFKRLLSTMLALSILTPPILPSAFASSTLNSKSPGFVNKSDSELFEMYGDKSDKNKLNKDLKEDLSIFDKIQMSENLRKPYDENKLNNESAREHLAFALVGANVDVFKIFKNVIRKDLGSYSPSDLVYISDNNPTFTYKKLNPKKYVSDMEAMAQISGYKAYRFKFAKKNSRDKISEVVIIGIPLVTNIKSYKIISEMKVPANKKVKGADFIKAELKDGRKTSILNTFYVVYKNQFYSIYEEIPFDDKESTETFFIMDIRNQSHKIKVNFEKETEDSNKKPIELEELPKFDDDSPQGHLLNTTLGE